MCANQKFILKDSELTRDANQEEDFPKFAMQTSRGCTNTETRKRNCVVPTNVIFFASVIYDYTQM